MKIELDPEQEDAVVVYRLKDSLKFLRRLPPTERAPDDGLLQQAIKRVLEFYGA